VENSCERGNEPSGSIKYSQTTKWLHNLCVASQVALSSTELVSISFSIGAFNCFGKTHYKLTRITEQAGTVVYALGTVERC
jgi:hypothetical protein